MAPIASGNLMRKALKSMQYRSAGYKGAPGRRRRFGRLKIAASAVGLLVFAAVLLAGPPDGSAKMYWTDLNGPDVVHRADLDGTNDQTLVTSASTVYSLDVDGSGGKVYYSDFTASRIYRMNLDGSGTQLLLSGLNGPNGLAVDTSGGKIYWTEQYSGKIRRANLDGSGAQDLVSMLMGPMDVALDLSAGKMYWTESGNRRVCRSNLDGSAMQVLITNVDNPRELALDTFSGYIYWAEEFNGLIRRSRLDGTGIATILSGLSNAYGVALDIAAGKIYYTHTYVGRANLDGSNPQNLIPSWAGAVALDYAVSPATYTISGTVFEDVNYGGGSGRNMAAASGVGRAGVTVELYNTNGVYLASTTTASGGAYSFSGLTAATYTVRVVDGTVTSSRSGSTGAEVAVQTFRTAGLGETAGTAAAKVGGEQPQSVDAPANSGSDTLAALQAPAGQYTQSVVTVSIASSNISGVDFGFNFDTIVNTNDSGQGSLRQFILNANLLANAGLDQDDWGVAKTAGVEYSIFMIPAGNSGYGTDPAGGGGSAFVIRLSSAGIGIINNADTAIDGRTQTAFTGDTNSPVANTSTGPEVVVDFGNADNGFVFLARGYLYDVGIYRSGAYQSVYFGNVTATGSVVQNATICQGAKFGMLLDSSSGITIADNVFRGNGTALAEADGISMNNSSTNTITRNAIVANANSGIEFWSGTCDGNIISQNYLADQYAGVYLNVGSQNTISRNTITNNSGDGIIVNTSATGNTITQNAIYANGGLGIDLSADGSYAGDDVTANDANDSDSGANDLLNFPVITSATGTGGTISVDFDLDVPAGNYRIEFFKNPSGADPSGYGEGEVFADAVSITHPGGGSRSFSHSLSGAAGDIITATATVDLGGGSFGSTSEFSAVFKVTAALPAISMTKSAALVSDPLNGTTNPIIIPGAVMQYTVSVTNQGPASPDSGTVVIANPVGSANMLFVGDLAGAGSGPLIFTDGTPASGLSYSFAGLSSTTDSLSFSNDNGATYTYTPAPDADGYDPAVTHLRVTPAGALAASDGTDHPGFTLQFRVKVR
jgi:parallel beta-helix repeat protein